jgi:uncharacterized membrane protein
MQNRDVSIDVLRGLSVVVMFYAHLLPYYLNSIEISFIERLICSVAAPLFLFLFGYNFSVSLKNQRRLIFRGLIIVLFAIVIDFYIYAIVPFVSFDILYMIGFSVFIMIIINRFSFRNKLLLSLVLIVISLSCQTLGYYQFDINEPSLFDEFDLNQSIRNLFISGWFPILPWFVFVILGNIFRTNDFSNRVGLKTILGLAIFTGALIFFYSPPIRSFSIEVFYPPNLTFISFAILIVLTAWKMRFILASSFLKIFSEFGRVSLFMYILHLFLFKTLDSIIPLNTHNRLIVLLVFLVFFWVFSVGINRLKNRFPFYQNNLLLAVLFGK